MKKTILCIALLFLSVTVLFAGGSSFGHLKLSNKKIIYNGQQFGRILVKGDDGVFLSEASEDIKSIKLITDKNRGDILKIELSSGWFIELPVMEIRFIIKEGYKLRIRV